jgi:hypothetical protein
MRAHHGEGTSNGATALQLAQDLLKELDPVKNTRYFVRPAARHVIVLVTSNETLLHNASGMLQTLPMGRDWSGTRWQDFIQVIQAVQDCAETPASEQPFLTALAATVYQQGVKNGIDWATWYTSAAFPKDAVGGWDYLPHGVNNGMAAKGGAVTWRGGLDAAGNVSSFERDAALMTYHGSPAGIFTADECLAGRMPSKGTETCAVVEQLFSLNVVHEIQGGAFFAERAERIAYNALPATGTKDLWARVYLQQQNEIYAGHTDPHVWNTDGADSTTYSLAGNYMCARLRARSGGCAHQCACGSPPSLPHQLSPPLSAAPPQAAPPPSTRAGPALLRTCCTRQATAGWP